MRNQQISTRPFNVSLAGVWFCLSVVFFLGGCASRTTSTIVACDYDKKHDQTNYTIFPYGSVSIPGKWKRTTYNRAGRQQFFENEHNVVLGVSFGPCNRYEFNADNSKKGFDFVKAFYDWESQYFANDYGMAVEIIEKNESEKYITWRIFGEYNNTPWDAYFIFGEKNGMARNFSIMETDKWTREQKLDFLKDLYLNGESRGRTGDIKSKKPA